MGFRDWLRGRPASVGIYSGGIGDSAKTAIVINVSNSSAGIAAEYAYVERECGQRGVDWSPMLQAQTCDGRKEFDVLTVILKSGDRRTFWFDISSFYGKF